MLELKHISKKFQDRVIIDDLSITFPDVGFIGIKGESGCGKSTLLYIIGMLDRDYEGEVFYQQQLIDDPSLFIRQHVSYMMQNKDIIEALNVKENIVLSALISQKYYSSLELFKIVRQLSIHEYLKRHPSQLSGGQLKRVSIAKALLKKSEIILCDEPTGALHLTQAHEVMKILKKVSSHSLVIIVSHDDDLLKMYCDSVLTLKNGQLKGRMRKQPTRVFDPPHKHKSPLWFYPLKQCLHQKYKLLFLLIFQWLIILSFFLIVTAFQGVFDAITLSEQQAADKRIISVERKDGQAFLELISDPDIYHVQYNYYLDRLDIKSYQTLHASLQFLPLQNDHILLKEGRMPQTTNEILITAQLQKELKQQETLQLSYQDYIKEMRIVGVLQDSFFKQNIIYCYYQYQEEVSFLRDDYTLLTETNKDQERNVYQKLSRSYFAYSEIIEKIDNYQSLLSLAQIVAGVFIAVSFFISLLFIGIVESIIYIERKHDTAYLLSLGLPKRRLFLLGLSEAFLLGLVVSIGGILLSQIAFYYINEVYCLKQHLLFELSLHSFFISQYDLYLIIAICYMMMSIIGICIPMKQMMKVDMIDVLREE